jgi:HAD superfamily hydrolase (TIGR01490 family)
MGLAFFDLDNTLIAGDSAQAFSEFIATSEVPTPADFLAVNQSFMDDYDAGRLNLHAYMRYTLAPLIGLRPKMVEELVQRFLDEVLNDRILPAARELLDHHRACGDELVIVSATGSHLVEPIAGRLAVPHVLAVDVERVEGLITGNMTGIPTFREGKVTRVQAWSQHHAVDFRNAHFYSDSHNDLPLLEAVRHPVAVDPDPHLRRIAAERGWPIISLR